MAADQQKLQSLSEAYQKIQDDLQLAIAARQTLESQSAENIAVQKEFSGLSDEANIYKLVGPVLLKQDKAEAKSAVDGRLQYINKEIDRTETRIKELQSESDQNRVDIMAIQQNLQVEGGGGGGGGGR